MKKPEATGRSGRLAKSGHTIFRPARLVALAIAVLLYGCGIPLALPQPASSPSSQGEIITVRTTPNGANVVIKNSTGEVLGSGVAPFQLRVRCHETILVTASADGYDSQTVEDDGTSLTTPLLNVGPFSFPAANNACHKLAEISVTLKAQELE